MPTPEVVLAIEELGGAISCIRGNHEDIFTREAFESSREEIYQHKRTKRQMNVKSLEFIMTWPAKLLMEFATGNALFVHGSPEDPTYGYVYPDTDLEAFTVAEPFVFMGHTHRPFIRRHKGSTYVNVGSCSMPRDQGALASVVLFNDQTGQISILRFNIQRETQEALGAIEQVHPSVINLFNRRMDRFEGETVGKQ